MTLVELSITVAIFMVVLVPILMTLLSSQRTTEDLRAGTAVRAQARLVVNELAKGIRQAQSPAAGEAPFAEATANAMTFYSPDMSTPVRMTRLRYRIVGDELRRQAVKSSNTGSGPWTWPAAGGEAVVLDHLSSGSRFVYRDSSGSITTTPDQVTQVELTLVTDTAKGPGGLQTFNQRVEIRTNH